MRPETGQQHGDAVCHRAPWLVTGNGGPIADGAVVVADGRIVALGRFTDCCGLAQRIVDHEDAVLTPALVNAHAHLELSHLGDLGLGEGQGDMPTWIGALLERRAELASEGDVNTEVAQKALAGLYNSGCSLVADIGNDPASVTLGQDGPVEVLFFLELLGLTRESEARALEMLAGLDPRTVATPHSPYSVTPGLLQALKARARQLGQICSIHLAESADEVALLADGSGGFPDFFRQRQVWDGSFAPPGCSPVAYIDRLGVLDEQTLCVHCVQMDETDVALLAQRRAKVCLCPGSNRTLGVGQAPVAAMLAHGILPALGTDSLASNPVLSIWREMHTLREDHPGLDPETVFAMATRGGAAALGRATDHGSLAKGGPARVLAVRLDGAAETKIFEFLTTVGEAVVVEWLDRISHQW